MGKQIKADYGQMLMFPPSVEDWVGKDHPARFIRDFVDSLDLRELGLSQRPSALLFFVLDMADFSGHAKDNVRQGERKNDRAVAESLSRNATGEQAHADR